MVKQTILFLMGTYVLIAAVFLAAAILTGCSEAKYIECIARDNTRNPCQ